MFEKIKEKRRQEEEQRQKEIVDELNRIRNLTEKELLIEILLELKTINHKCDDIDDDIRIYSSIN